MINSYNVKKYCCENPSLIENYEIAVNDKHEKWDIHHRLETEEGISATELKKQNRYFNRPASELIFLSHREHAKIHNEGVTRPEYVGKKISEATKGKIISPETIEKQRATLIEYYKTHNACNKGFKNSKEANEKVSNTLKYKYKTGEITIWNKGKTKETDTRITKCANSHKGMKYKKHKTYDHPSKGKHRVYDNKELNIYHYE